MKNCTFPVRSGRGKCYLCKDLFSNNPQRFYFIMKRIILLLVSLLPVLSAFRQLCGLAKEFSGQTSLEST